MRASTKRKNGDPPFRLQGYLPIFEYVLFNYCFYSKFICIACQVDREAALRSDKA
ncbi:MAG: hypothetical protein ACRC2R_00925 [Xenococcaceae cyanobacterium]